MRKFSYERTASLYRALQKTGEPFNLHVLRSDAYSGFYPEHNYGEYNIYRLPDYGDFDAILLDINSVFDAKSNEYSAMGIQYIVRAGARAENDGLYRQFLEQHGFQLQNERHAVQAARLQVDRGDLPGAH